MDTSRLIELVSLAQHEMIKQRKVKAKTFNTFTGRDLIDWLLTLDSLESKDKDKAKEVANAMLSEGLILAHDGGTTPFVVSSFIFR